MKTEFCECATWCRSDVTAPYGLRTRAGAPLITNHHPNCEHYNDSLMDVWKVGDGDGTYYYDHDENFAQDVYADLPDGTIEKLKMHREIYENLPEFDGF